MVVLLPISFIGRVMLAEFKPEYLKQKWLKIGPHVLDTLLLLSGIALVFQGNWLSGDYAWLLAKLLVMLVYIGLGVAAMHSEGRLRWLACFGALLCLVYIVKVAVSKQVLFFL